MRRNLDEILASQRTMLQRRQVADPGPPDDQMRRYFENHLNKIRRWITDLKIPCLECDYNQLLQNPDPLLADISAFLDGRPDPVSMRAVIRPELYHNKKTPAVCHVDGSQGRSPFYEDSRQPFI